VLEALKHLDTSGGSAVFAATFTQSRDADGMTEKGKRQRVEVSASETRSLRLKLDLVNTPRPYGKARVVTYVWRATPL
jgi:hypothetical protein